MNKVMAISLALCGGIAAWGVAAPESMTGPHKGLYPMSSMPWTGFTYYCAQFFWLLWRLWPSVNMVL